MSFTTIHEDAACKTNLFYREGEGLSLERVVLQTKQKTKMPISPAEIEGLIREWPKVKDLLHSAGVQIAAPGMPSRSGSMASQGHDR